MGSDFLNIGFKSERIDSARGVYLGFESERMDSTRGAYLGFHRKHWT